MKHEMNVTGMKPLADAFARIVEAAGFSATVDADDDVRFTVQGTSFYIETQAGDEHYIRYFLSFALGTDVPIARAYAVANDVNIRLKGAKTTVYAADVTYDDVPFVRFSIESFFADVADQAPVFERSIASLRSASDAFFERLGALAGATAW